MVEDRGSTHVEFNRRNASIDTSDNLLSDAMRLMRHRVRSVTARYLPNRIYMILVEAVAELGYASRDLQ